MSLASRLVDPFPNAPSSGTSLPPRAGSRLRSLTAGLLACALLALFAARALLAASRLSPTFDEVSHLPAGASYLATGDFRMNPEHPPLVKELCALPLVIGGESPDVGS